MMPCECQKKIANAVVVDGQVIFDSLDRVSAGETASTCPSACWKERSLDLDHFAIEAQVEGRPRWCLSQEDELQNVYEIFSACRMFHHVLLIVRVQRPPQAVRWNEGLCFSAISLAWLKNGDL